MTQFQEYLQSDYPGFASFIDTIIKPIFGANFKPNQDYDDMVNYPDELEDFDEIENSHDEELKKQADDSGLERILKLGTIKVQGDTRLIYVYDITVSKRRQLSRNRKGIQQLISRTLTNQSGAFMLFHYNDAKWEWRFSYKFVGKDKDDSTNSKRFTYLFGKNQVCKTAAQRFSNLLKKKCEITIYDITDAFSVEALSKEFFDTYKAHYEHFCQFVYDNKNNSNYFGEEFSMWEDKAIRDYVKKLLGRIVFLHFLQKKGWMGVPVDKQWGEGDLKFMMNLYDSCSDEQKANYLDEVLEPMFEDLNNQRINDYAGEWSNAYTIAEEKSGIKIPYLNGGLFEREATDLPKSVFPADYFADLFDFFNQYNFTIDENDPNDAEVGIDPEMLGRIFENLLEDNKDKGAFYTPKEIVQYMCRESLIAYLQTDVDDEPTKEAIRQFVTTHDATTLGNIADDIDQRLKDVKICDPAIGSGAFPMGLLKELFDCRMAIEDSDKGKTPSEIKKDIIQNSIYGVDIEKGAVDIARLRFWLSLVIDEQTPHALPNMDFKIMQGNSLLELYNGFDLSTIMHSKKKVEGPIQMTFFEDNVDELRRQVIALRRKYFRETNKAEKKNLRNRMREIVQQQINALSYNINLSGIDIAKNAEFFLWHTWFSDVFENGGFDIVIGNPPYVEAKKLKYIASTLKSIFSVYSGTADLSIYFVELGMNILTEKGILSFITTNKFFNTGYGKKMRKLVTSNTIQKIINFEQVEVFEDILVSSVIIEIAKQNVDKGNWLTYERFYKLKKEQFIPEFINRQESCGKYLQDYLDEKEWSFSDMTELVLKEKIENGSHPLADIEGISINRGVTTGYNPAFIINDERKAHLISEDARNVDIIKNLLQGRNIRKWYYNESDENLLFIPWHFPLHNDNISGASDKAEKELEKQYQSIYNWLKSHKDSLSERNQDETGIRYEWYALQRCAASYYKEFEYKEKIIWGLTADKWAFTIDAAQHYLPSNGYILTSTKLPIKYILGLLNSKLMHYYFHFIGIMTAGGAYTLKAATISAMPFKIANNTQEIADIVEKILAKKSENHDADVSDLESEIDSHVYQLYGLTEEEIKIVEGK